MRVVQSRRGQHSIINNEWLFRITHPIIVRIHTELIATSDAVQLPLVNAQPVENSIAWSAFSPMHRVKQNHWLDSPLTPAYSWNDGIAGSYWHSVNAAQYTQFSIRRLEVLPSSEMKTWAKRSDRLSRVVCSCSLSSAELSFFVQETESISRASRWIRPAVRLVIWATDRERQHGGDWHSTDLDAHRTWSCSW